MDQERPTTSQLALRAVSAAADSYAANPALRGAVVVAVPFVGAAFDTFVGTFGTNIAMERMGIFLEELRQRIATLEEARRDRAVTEADLVDATIRGVRGALETGDRDKVRMIASVLVGATSVERPEALDTESVMASLISLTPADLAYARRLAEAMREKRSSFIEYSGVPAPDPDRQFRRLASKGWRLYWTWRSHTQLGRPRLGAEVRELIAGMSGDNRLCGSERIRGELLKLGIVVSNRAIRRYRWCGPRMERSVRSCATNQRNLGR